jgi:hypothetical protein
MGKTWGQDYWWLIIGNIGWWLSICCFQLMKNWRKHNYRYSQHVTNNQLLSHVVPIVWYWPRPMSISQKCSRGCTRWNEPKNNRVHETTAKRHGLSSIQRARILVNMPALQNGLRLKQLGFARSRILTANLRSMIFCNEKKQHEQEIQP